MSTLPAARAQSTNDPVSPDIYLKTYSNDSKIKSETTSWSNDGYLVNGSLISKQNTLCSWDYLLGGTNNADYLQDLTTIFSDPDTGDVLSTYGGIDYSGTGTNWTSASVPGTLVWTNAQTSLLYPNDPTFNFTNIYVQDTNVGPPSFTWQMANVSLIQSSTNLYTNDVTGGITSTLWNYSSDMSITTTIELSTGGVPGSTNQSTFVITAWAIDMNTGFDIDPLSIDILGLVLGTNGQATVDLNDNSYYDLTPVLPDIYNNYLFGVSAGYPPDGGPGITSTNASTISISKMQYQCPAYSTTWHDITNTLYILNGTTVKFRVIPNPANATWPSGSPAWKVGGASAGNGPEITRQFTSVAANSADFKQVIATYGSSSITNQTLTFDVAPQYTPDDNFSGRSTNQFGVGEIIHLDVVIAPAGVSKSTVADITWQLVSGSATLDALGTDGTGVLYGPEVAQTVICGAYIKQHITQNDPPTQINVAVPFIAPSSLAYTIRSGLWHLPGRFTIGFYAETQVIPPWVSWNRIEIGEPGGEVSRGTGWFQNIVATHQAGDRWAKVIQRNDNGNLKAVLEADDWISYADPRLNNFADGTIGGNIKETYHVKSANGNYGDSLFLPDVLEIFTSDANGTASAKKGNAGPYSKAIDASNDLFPRTIPALWDNYLRANGFTP